MHREASSRPVKPLRQRLPRALVLRRMSSLFAMKIFRVRMVWILLPITAGLLLYLFWPFSSRDWDIEFDQQAIDSKKRYLEGL